VTGPAAFDRLVSAPDILGGKPIVRCTRISVEFLLELVASGGSVADIVAAYPFLTPAHVRHAVPFAAGTLTNEVDLTADVA
jgi:uncharacterized protein (DUF433 family)